MAVAAAGFLDRERREARLIDANLRCAMRFFGRGRAGAVCEERDGWLLVCSHLNYGAFNAALCVEPFEGPRDLERRLQVPSNFFGPRGLRWTMWVCLNALPRPARAELDAVCLSRGLRRLADPPGLYAAELGRASRALPEVTAQPVSRPDQRYAFAHITAATFDIPLSYCRAVYESEAWNAEFEGYIGAVGGLPVTSAALVRSPGAIGIYSVGTLPPHRGKGYAEALLRRIVPAKDEGFPLVLQATRAGLPLYQRLGFRRAARFRVFITD